LSENGFMTFTFDYQGIGESRPKRLKGFKCSVTDWAENNINTVVDYVSAKVDFDNLIIMGHSIGGQLIGLSKVSAKTKGLILVASQGGFWKMWPPSQRWSMWLNWFIIIPVFTRLFGYLPAKKFGI